MSRILVVAAEPISGEALHAALGDPADGAEVMVLTPALNDSRLAYWVSDVDEAIAEAEAVQEETVERLEEEGIDAAGTIGESDPVVALEDALAQYPAERVVIFKHPSGQRAYREDELAAAGDRLGVPVVQAEVTR